MQEYFRRLAAAVCLIGLVSGTPVLAQDSAGTTSEGRLLTFANQRDPKVVADGWKQFYFYRQGTSYAEALADLTDCYRFLELSKTWLPTPSFAPWNEQGSAITEAPAPMMGGILSGLIGSALIKTQNRRATQSRLRRCMEPRGYQRYPLSEADWKWLVADFSPETLPMQARYASGQAPDAEPLAVTK